MANLTKSQQEQVEKYVKQGIDRQTAIRVVTAKPATSRAKGSLNTCNREFSLLK